MSPAAVPPWPGRIAVGAVTLRRPVPADAAGVFSVHGDPRTYELDPDLTHPDVAASAAFLVPPLEHWQRYGFGLWTVLVPASWWPAGVPGPGPDDAGLVHAGLGGIRHHVMAGEPVLNVYYRLAPAVQGRGLAGTVLSTAVEQAARTLPGLDLVVRTRPDNAAARRVAERGGFVDQGLEPGTDDMHLLRRPAAVRPDL